MFEKFLLTARETATMLSISERTLWSLSNAGKIPVVRIGRSVRYSIEALEAWIAGKPTGTTLPA